ncbi:hypothetical protein SASPL_121544 [Salvia splendens]|uniref:Uncharacterized protein n=1 Tax=Salvia splendens TaxID=180675 RepID=A0A8X8ZUV2_SALSN|nr:hypothetical protein SASPL_121544 [Salvia splendens]
MMPISSLLKRINCQYIIKEENIITLNKIIGEPSSGKSGGAGEELREIEVSNLPLPRILKNVKHIRKMRAFAEVYVERASTWRGRGWTSRAAGRSGFHKGAAERDVMARLNVDIYADSHLGLEKPVGSARVLLV